MFYKKRFLDKENWKVYLSPPLGVKSSHNICFRLSWDISLWEKIRGNSKYPKKNFKNKNQKINLESEFEEIFYSFLKVKYINTVS